MGQYTFTDELKRLALNTRAVCFGSLAQRNEANRITINRFLDTMPDGAGTVEDIRYQPASGIFIPKRFFVTPCAVATC